MDNLKKCYIILWSEELGRPHLNLVWLSQHDIENGFQFGDQYIENWVVFDDLTQCQELLEIMCKECAA